MRNLFRAVALLSACGLLASCSVYRQLLGDSATKISTHLETSGPDHPMAIMNLPIDGRNMTFRKLPEFSHRSIAGFEAFPADDGQGFGLLLQLDMKGRNALESASRLNQGSKLLTFVNGVPVDMVELDQPIIDGRFTIWRGISQEAVDDLDKYYPRLKYMKSESRAMDMVPSTFLMKLRAREEAKKLEAAEKKAQLDRERGVLPPAPKTKEIPLEGFKTPGT